MRFPSIAYSFARPTDVSGPTALIFSRHLQISTGDVVLDQLFSDLPKDRILVLTNVSMRADPGPTQIVILMAVQAISQGVLNFTIAAKQTKQIATQNEDLNWQGEVYIQGGGPNTDTLRFHTQFNSGANANLMTIGVHGIIIPRGNMGGF